MPFTFTAAPSSRVNKSRARNPLLSRSSSSPFAALPRRKPLQRAHTKPEADHDEALADRLDNLGIVSLADGLSSQNAIDIISHIQNNMFDHLPERAAMNSTRIAELLNFRKSLPPLSTTAHLHALTKSPTTVERELARMMTKGVVRKHVVPGRGVGMSSISETLVLVNDWMALIRASTLDPEVKEKYILYLKSSPLASVIPRTLFTALEATALMQAGFLTSSSRDLNSPNIFVRPDGSSSSSGTMTSIASISKAASGSMAAIGGEGAVHGAGGGGSGGLQISNLRQTSSSEKLYQQTLPVGEELQLALPNTGSFLRLLSAARSHLLFLLSRSKHREAPLYLLRERWNGGIPADDSSAKFTSGQFGVLPGRTRKWKHFYGLNFDWILAECLGGGLVEVFETGSVGRGARAI